MVISLLVEALINVNLIGCILLGATMKVTAPFEVISILHFAFAAAVPEVQ